MDVQRWREYEVLKSESGFGIWASSRKGLIVVDKVDLDIYKCVSTQVSDESMSPANSPSKGDVLLTLNGESIGKYSELILELQKCEVGTVMRFRFAERAQVSNNNQVVNKPARVTQASIDGISGLSGNSDYNTNISRYHSKSNPASDGEPSTIDCRESRDVDLKETVSTKPGRVAYMISKFQNINSSSNSNKKVGDSNYEISTCAIGVKGGVAMMGMVPKPSRDADINHSSKSKSIDVISVSQPSFAKKNIIQWREYEVLKSESGFGIWVSSRKGSIVVDKVDLDIYKCVSTQVFDESMSPANSPSKGDVLLTLNGESIGKYSELISELQKCEVGTVMRFRFAERAQVSNNKQAVPFSVEMVEIANPIITNSSSAAKIEPIRNVQRWREYEVLKSESGFGIWASSRKGLIVVDKVDLDIYKCVSTQVSDESMSPANSPSKGDVLLTLNGESIGKYSEIILELQKCEVGTVMRFRFAENICEVAPSTTKLQQMASFNRTEEVSCCKNPLNYSVMKIFNTLNALLVTLGTLLVAVGLYFIFTSKNNVDPTFFLGLGIQIMLVGFIVGLLAWLGQQGVFFQNSTSLGESKWNGRKMLNIYCLILFLLIVAEVYVISSSYAFLKDINAAYKEIASVSQSKWPKHNSAEDAVAEKFNNFFFAATNACNNINFYDTYNKLFWEYIDKACPEEINSIRCKGCGENYITQCYADQVQCFDVENSEGSACAYDICRKAILESVVTNINPICYATLAFIAFQVLLLIMGFILRSYTKTMPWNWI